MTTQRQETTMTAREDLLLDELTLEREARARLLDEHRRLEEDYVTVLDLIRTHVHGPECADRAGERFPSPEQAESAHRDTPHVHDAAEGPRA